MTPNQILDIQDENKILIKKLQECSHDFRWMITIALGLGFTIGWIARGMV
jgi:hypothetical protein